MRQLLQEIKENNIHIYLQGDSLKLKFNQSKLPDSILNKIKAHKEELIAYIKTTQAKTSSATIDVVTKEDQKYPLSSSQKRLWVLSQQDDASRSYNMPFHVEMNHDFDIESFNKAIASTVERHEILRTVFVTDEKQNVWQTIKSVNEIQFEMDHIDFRNEIDKEAKIQEYIKKDAQQLFDLENGPLFRIALLQVEDQKFVFYYNMHHIISDAWSLKVLAQDVFAYYDYFSKGKPHNLNPLRIQYKDYATWQQNNLQDEKVEIDKKYWKEVLSDSSVVELPVETERPKIKTQNGRRFQTYIPQETINKVKDYTDIHGGSLFMTLLSVFKITLQKYTGQKDILIGTLHAGRDHIDLENQIGFYVNTIPLRTTVDPKHTFTEVYDTVKQNTINSFNHRSYPLDLIIEDLDIQNDTSRNALIDILFVLQNVAESDNPVEEININTKDILDKGTMFSRFDIEINMQEVAGSLSFVLNFNEDIYDSEMMSAFMSHYKLLLQTLPARPNQPICEVDFMSQDEKEKLVGTYNNTHANITKGYTTVLELFEEQVRDNGDAIALDMGVESITYKELDKITTRFSNYLKINYDIKPNEFIGIKLKRSQWPIISILAVLKSGGSYVPIDPTYPEDRIVYIEQDSGLKVCIDEKEIERFLKERFTYSTDVKINAPKPNHQAYAIYTSGSTGKPKGVVIKHESLMNYICWAKDYYRIENSRMDFCFFTSLSFDLTVTSLFLPLVTGGTLTILESKLDIDEQLQAYVNSKADYIKLTPAHINVLGNLNLEQITTKVAIVGGDILHHSQVNILKNLNPEIKIYNEYGPTEATVGCIVYDVDRLQTAETPIGKPIANTTIYILDEYNKLTPEGVVGEICIGGIGLAKGYLGRTELTNQKFIKHPFNKEEKIYKTGDLGSWMKDGNLKFLGRKDNQVKVNGHRIELGEIENTLLTHPNIKEAAVLAVADANSENELIAYYAEELHDSNISYRNYFKNILPGYMIPQEFIAIEKFPLTSNGKINRKKLLEQRKNTTEATAIGIEAPIGTLENTIARIWQEILKKDNVNRTSDFYELGGNSLKMIRLISEYYKAFSVKLKMKELFSQTSFLTHAEMISTASKTIYYQIEKAEEAVSYPLSDAQKTLWLLSQFKERAVAYNIPVSLELTKIEDIAKLKKAVLELISRHEILRTVFKADQEGEVRQWILSTEDVDFTLEHIDLTDDLKQNETINSYIQSDTNKSFDLANGPLFRIALFELGEGRFTFYCNMFHIISDEVSIQILKRDLFEIYQSLIDNRKPQLPELRIQYKDFSVWQYQNVGKEKFIEDKTYWSNKLSGKLPMLNLPTQQQRPKIKTYNGHVLGACISEELSSKFKTFCLKKGGSLFMGGLAVWYILLQKYTKTNDLIIGTPVAGRNHADLKDQIGCYINNIALRFQLNPTDNFETIFNKVKQVTIENLEHQSYPFYRIVEDLGLSNDVSRNQIFDVMFSYHIENENNPKVPYTTDIINLGAAKSKLDILINFYDYGNYLYFDFNFNVDVYDIKLAKELIKNYKLVLQKLLEEPALAIEYIDHQSEQAKEKMNKNKNKLRMLAAG